MTLAFGAGAARVPAAPRPAAAGPATMAALTQQITDALLKQDLAKGTVCLSKKVQYLVNTEP